MVLVDAASGRGYIGANPEKLKIVGDPLGTEDFGFIFTKIDLVAAFNAAIQSMKDDGFLDYLNTRWFYPVRSNRKVGRNILCLAMPLPLPPLPKKSGEGINPEIWVWSAATPPTIPKFPDHIPRDNQIWLHLPAPAPISCRSPTGSPDCPSGCCSAITLGLLMLWGFVRNENYRIIFNAVRKGVGRPSKFPCSPIFLAMGLGLLLSLMRVHRSRITQEVSSFYTEVMRGVPMLVLLYYISFVGAPALVSGHQLAGEDR